MTGWRLGWIVAPPALMPDLGKLIEYNTSCSPVFVQRAGVAAITRRRADGRATRARASRRARPAWSPSLRAIAGHRGRAAAGRDVRVLPRRRASPTASRSASGSCARRSSASRPAARSGRKAKASSAGASRQLRACDGVARLARFAPLIGPTSIAPAIRKRAPSLPVETDDEPVGLHHRPPDRVGFSSITAMPRRVVTSPASRRQLLHVTVARRVRDAAVARMTRAPRSCLRSRLPRRSAVARQPTRRQDAARRVPGRRDGLRSAGDRRRLFGLRSAARSSIRSIAYDYFARPVRIVPNTADGTAADHRRRPHVHDQGQARHLLRRRSGVQRQEARADRRRLRLQHQAHLRSEGPLVRPLPVRGQPRRPRRAAGARAQDRQRSTTTRRSRACRRSIATRCASASSSPTTASSGGSRRATSRRSRAKSSTSTRTRRIA